MLRYTIRHGISSKLDPIQDVLCLLQYGTASEYLEEILQKVHHLSPKEATLRSKKIIPHIAVAIDYIRDGLKAKEELSFLSLYYGLLNLSKVYVLLGPLHARLATERTHGVSYNPNGKESRSLRTEVITISTKGALPLLCETLTKRAPKLRKVTLGQVLPYLSGVGAEYSLAVGQKNNIHTFELTTHYVSPTAKVGFYRAKLVRQSGDTTKYNRHGFRALKEFRQDKADPDTFIGNSVRRGMMPLPNHIFNQFDNALIYSTEYEEKKFTFTTPYFSTRIDAPEEFPILLLFYYMSSVVRYRPDYLEKLRNSRYWPILSASRQHCTFRMLMLAWSFLHKKELHMEHA